MEEKPVQEFCHHILRKCTVYDGAFKLRSGDAASVRDVGGRLGVPSRAARLAPRVGASESKK